MDSSTSAAVSFLKEKHKEYREEIAAIDKAIAMLSGSFTELKQQSVKYIKLEEENPLKRKRGRPAKVIYVQPEVKEKREKLTLPDKIIRVLRSKYRFLHESEIVSICISNYSSERNLPKEEVAKNVSDALKTLKKEGKVINYSGLDMKKTYWGFEEWLNRKGEIKEENMYEMGR